MENFSNLIKSYTEYRIDLDTEKEYPYLQKHFRKDEQLTLVKYYTKLGKCFSRKAYAYDEKGNKIEELLTGDYLESEKWTHHYNQQNQRTTSYFYKNNVLEDYYEYHFNEQGQCIEELQYNQLKELEIRIVYQFNEQNQIIQEDNYNADNYLIETITKTYNDNHQIIRYDNFIYNDDKTIEEYFYILSFYSNSKLQKEEHFSYYQGGTSPSKTIESYNGKGKKTKTIKYNEEEELIEELDYFYEYDSHQNWTKKLVFKSGQIIESSIRAYVYY